MRGLGIWLLGVCLAAGQSTPMPATGPERAPAVVRGVLLERDAQAGEGEFSVRRADNLVFRYRFDRKTYVEREHDLIEVARLRPGEKVEVVSDTIPGFALRYARTVHVLDEPPARLTATASTTATTATTQGRYRAYRSVEERDRTLPTGNLTYSGVVFRITPEKLVLHTRDGGEQALAVGKDTRYMRNGEIVTAEALQMNTRVFVRAGKDLSDQVEAYQVIWGKILDPQ
jgi:hypothetical protein